MICCDLCRKQLLHNRDVWIEAGKDQVNKKHICTECIQICKEIVNNAVLDEYCVVSLNEYKDLKEQGKL